MMMGKVEAQRVVCMQPKQAGKRLVSIRWLLEWAFQREKVQLDFGQASLAGQPLPSFGMEYIMMEQARLGCRVDGGGRSQSHHDADIAASALAALPEGHGGQRIAIWVAELARAGQEPDWMRAAITVCVPSDTHTNRHGRFAKTADASNLGAQGWPPQPRRNRKGVIVHDKVQYCPVICRDTTHDIARARRAYLQWWGVLLELRGHFQIYGGLTTYEITDEMPPRAPWTMGGSKRS